jgi:hypothetical protein
MPEPTSTGEQPVTGNGLHDELRRWLGKQFGGSLIAALLAALAVGFGAYKAVAGEAREAADAGIRPVKLEVDDLGRRVSRVESQTIEVQADIRALYKAVMTGRPQERLEHPAPRVDGGPAP